MKKINISKIIALFLIVFTYSQCINITSAVGQTKNTPLSDYDKLENYLHTLSNTLSVKNYDAIIFISDKEGSCFSCLKSFSDFVSQNLLNYNRILIILNAKGERINTSPYLSDTVKNVVTDYSNDFFRLKMATTATSVIVIKENKIEGVCPVNPETLSEQMVLLARMRYSENKTK